MSIIFLPIVLVLLICLSAFFSSSETAFLSITRLRLRQMQKENPQRTKKVALLKSNMDNLLTTILIGNNFVNNLASSLATALAISLVGQNGTGIATLVMTILILIFGEILPKTIASYKPEKIAIKVASCLLFLQKILHPLVWLFSKITKSINKAINMIWKSNDSIITEEELKTLIDVGDKEGTLEKGEKEMLYKIFEFSDLRVRDIQRHRSHVMAVSENATYKETLQMISDSGYSRLPVFKDDIDSVVGLIHYKDVLFYTGLEKDFSITDILRPVLFVPETLSALDLLYQFKAEKRNLAIVVNEHGSHSGMVTMDDILRAVFGRITDEYNTKTLPAEERIKAISPTEFIFPGDLLLSDINAIFHLQLQSEEFDTIGGWLLEQFGYLPATTEMLKKGTLLFTIEEQVNRRIQSIRLQFTKQP